MIPAHPLEDGFADVVSKAMRGLVLSDALVATKCGVSPLDIAAFRTGKWDEFLARKVAPVLGLDPECLIGLAENQATPPPISVSELEMFYTPFGDMMVNSYLVCDVQSKVAVAFDTGSDATEMLQFSRANSLHLEALFLTHTHGDHIFEMDRIRESTGTQVLVNEREPLDGATCFRPGEDWQFGRFRIESRLTWGHSRGGTTYIVHGASQLIAVVGDALFAGSMGGGLVSYRDAISTNRSEILSLKPDAVLCPGHGPLTTVGWELKHNPFFGPATR